MKKNSRIAAVVLAAALLLLVVVPVAAEEIAVQLNDRRIAFDQPPVLFNDRTMVPLRAIFEAMGADVYWSQEQQLIVGVKNDTKVFLQVGEERMYRTEIPEGAKLGSLPAPEEIYLDAPPMILGGRTLVPVRAVCDAFGAQVDWDGASRTVILTMPQAQLEDVNRDKGFYPLFYDTLLAPRSIAGNLFFLDVEGNVLLDSSDFENVVMVPDEDATDCYGFLLTLLPERARAYREETARLAGKPWAERMIDVYVDEIILDCLDPVAGMEGNVIRVGGGFSRQVAEEILARIKGMETAD